MATNWPNSVQTFTNPSASDGLNSPSHSAQHTTVNDTVEALQQYAGSVLVKTQTIGSGVSSVTVTNAFDSRFKNYRIFYDVLGGSASAFTLFLSLGATATGYYWSRTLTLFSTGAIGSVNGANDARWHIGAVRGTSNTGGQGHVDLMSPYEARPTMFNGASVYMFSTGYAETNGGYLDAVTQYTEFTLAPSAGTMTGGTVQVYGYNDG
jgi:hypothetical protein